jgi:hypothetical protein
LHEWGTDLEVPHISECGHWVQNETSDEVNEALLEYLGRAVMKAKG